MDMSLGLRWADALLDSSEYLTLGRLTDASSLSRWHLVRVNGNEQLQ